VTRSLRWLLPALCLGLPFSGSLSAQAIEVVELGFAGATAFPHAELASAITTRSTRCPRLLLGVLCRAGAGSEAYLEPGALEADALRLRLFYHERGFRQADIAFDTVRSAGGVAVTFRVTEGRPIRVASVDLVDGPPDVRLLPLPLEAGAPFDVLAHEAARDTLLTRLRNNGYARAHVLLGYEVSRDDPYSARVWYEIVAGQPARIGEISVTGNREASPELVRRMLTFREGSRYDRSALLESQRNLYGLQIFRHAEVRADLAADEGPIPIVIQVAEGNMRRVRVGGGISNAECANIEGRWLNRNFRGDGRRLELRGQVGNLLMDQCQQVPVLRTDYEPYRQPTGLVSADFSQPWFFGPRNTVGVGLFAERRSVPEVFVRTATGGHASIGRNLGRNTGLTLAYRPEWTRLGAEGDVFFCVNFIACAYEDTRLLREPHWLAPVTLTFSADRTDAVFTPSAGYVVRADVEHAGRYTGSSFAYTRMIGEASTYTGRQGGTVLAARVRGGIAWPHGGSLGTGAVRVNPQKRFFAGGANSVRGFDQYRLGPTVLGINAVPWLADLDDPETVVVEGAGCDMAAINDGSCDVGMLGAGLFQVRPVGGEVLLEGNVELRFPLPFPGGRLRGAAFVDAGQVWLTAPEVSFRDLVATPGVGVRYYSPVGPIRVDAGFDTRGARTLNVLTTRVEECLFTGVSDCQQVSGSPGTGLRNTGDIVTLDRSISFGSGLGDMASWGDFFRRFRLHFSIGQAF
jgi:outer membrane protein assembly factor BamA